MNPHFLVCNPAPPSVRQALAGVSMRTAHRRPWVARILSPTATKLRMATGRGGASAVLGLPVGAQSEGA